MVLGQNKLVIRENEKKVKIRREEKVRHERMHQSCITMVLILKFWERGD